MDFGKLPNVDGVDFSLPPDPPENAAWMSGEVRTVRLCVGATGYRMKEWVGRWYPAGTPERLFLKCYGQQFNTIEHNTTHYLIPDAETVKRWCEAVPPDFRFCPKIPQSISHARSLLQAQEEMTSFCAVISGLGERLGCCFAQLPPHFSPARLGELEHFLERYAGQIPLAVEVRHPDFFADAAAGQALFALLEEQRTAAVITDVAGRRDVCHMRLTTRRTLIRFVGNALHPTDFSRVRQWAERLALWSNRGIEEVYFFCHEPDNLLAPELALFAVQLFGEHLPQAQCRGPQPLPTFGGQMSLFE